MASVDTRYFDHLYETSDDPWALASRWYERRKRALTLACLPAQRLGSVFEPGCAAGELTVDLAARASRVLAMDLNARAVAKARNRTAEYPHVDVRTGLLPDDWPDEKFDLIVLSEIGYYFSPACWAEVAARCVASLKPRGAVLACHWLHDFDARCQSTQAVHGAIGRRPGLFPQVDHAEKDFILQLWSLADISVAEQEQSP